MLVCNRIPGCILEDHSIGILSQIGAIAYWSAIEFHILAPICEILPICNRLGLKDSDSMERMEGDHPKTGLEGLL